MKWQGFRGEKESGKSVVPCFENTPCQGLLSVRCFKINYVSQHFNKVLHTQSVCLCSVFHSILLYKGFMDDNELPYKLKSRKKMALISSFLENTD